MNGPEPACAIPDLGPEVYTRWRASEIGATTERLEGQLILALLGDVSGCRVLDVGCGDGKFALELTKRGAIVTGIDASAAMIDAAKGPGETTRYGYHLSGGDGRASSVPSRAVRCGDGNRYPLLRRRRGPCLPRDRARVATRRPSRHWRARQVEHMGGWASRSRLAGLAAVAPGPVLDCNRASGPRRTGRFGRQERARGDLLSAVGPHRAATKPLRSRAEPTYHDWCWFRGALCDQAWRKGLERSRMFQWFAR